jgi:hypothetical protein
MVGNIYVLKGEDVPDEIAISLETPGGKKREEKGLRHLNITPGNRLIATVLNLRWRKVS